MAWMVLETSIIVPELH